MEVILEANKTLVLDFNPLNDELLDCMCDDDCSSDCDDCSDCDNCGCDSKDGCYGDGYVPNDDCFIGA